MRNSYADVDNKTQLPVWLLTLEMPDGEILRFSSEPISVDTSSTLLNGPYQYTPMLSGVSDYTEELDLFSLDGVGALTQIKVDIAWNESIAQWQADWRHVTALTAELAQIWRGQAWEDRIILLYAGQVQGLEFGVAGQTTQITLESTPPSSSAGVGDDTRDMGDDWDSVTDRTGASMSDLTGRKYQWVFGDPESVPGYKVGGPLAGANKLVLAGHHFPDTSTITVYEDGRSIGTFTPQNATISSGDYCYVESGTDFDAADGAYTYKAAHGGIVGASDINTPALNAGEILKKLLTMSGLTVDWALMQPTIQALQPWRIGFYLDKQSDALKIIEDKIVPYVPIIRMQSGTGVWYAYIDPWRAPVEGTLVEGQALLGRVGRMYISDMDAIYNSFTINYAPEEYSEELTETAYIDDTNNALCYLSKQLYGDRPYDVIDANVVWSQRAAEQILLNMVSRYALPRRRIQYQLAPDWYWIRAGMVFYLQADTQGIENKQRAAVLEINRSMNPYIITLDMIDRTSISAR